MTPHPWQARVRAIDPVGRSGRVRRIAPSRIEADGPAVTLGALCRIEARAPGGRASLLAEVIRVDRDSIALAPLEIGASPFAGARVEAVTLAPDIAVGDALLGCAIDALGRPLDGGGAIRTDRRWPLYGMPIAPLDRASPLETLETGCRAIDGLVTLGRGQRVGIFAAAGTGKTSLVVQLAAHVGSDMTVLALIGERGREVEAVWSGLPAAVRARTAMVAATSDQPATMRVRAAHHAIALAEAWRARGRHVLLLMDSVTRLAMAMREIGLAAGEPPTVRAYTPNVFAAVPRLIERAGALRSGGAISMIATVLAETDEIDDPVCEMMKSLLDGHIILSRDLAEDGHFPAIDVVRSVSRQTNGLLPADQLRRARQATGWLAALDRSRTMRQAGLYAAGSDARIDEAVLRQTEMMRFLRQGQDERSTIAETRRELARLVGENG